MAHIKRNYKRPSGKRDAKLFVVATEGTETERQYFEGLLTDKYFPNPKVHLVVLNRLDTASSPDRVIKLLNEFRKEYSLTKFDEIWMVIDRDKQSWTNQMISNIAALCYQKKYNLAISNPCFELWLLLHIKNINEYSKIELAELFENKKNNTYRNKLETELLNILGSYNKAKLDLSKFLPFVHSAIHQAKELDIYPSERWTNDIGTRVYRLVEKLIDYSDNVYD